MGDRAYKQMERRATTLYVRMHRKRKQKRFYEIDGNKNIICVNNEEKEITENSVKTMTPPPASKIILHKNAALNKKNRLGNAKVG